MKKLKAIHGKAYLLIAALFVAAVVPNVADGDLWPAVLSALLAVGALVERHLSHKNYLLTVENNRLRRELATVRSGLN